MFDLIARIVITAVDVFLGLSMLKASARDKDNSAFAYVLMILVFIDNIAFIWS